MIRKNPLFTALAAVGLSLSLAGFTAAPEDEAYDHGLVINTPEGPVDEAAGLAAWDAIFEVFSHPRCANCHTDDRNIPMWTGLGYGDDAPHGMNINAGDSRMGLESIPCSTCHINSAAPNTVPNAPPHTGHPWMLAPVEFLWFDQSSADICVQVSDPERNGGRDGEGLVEHIIHDAEIRAFITWGFNPGGGREPAPGTMQEHLDDMVTWTAAGMPCPAAATEEG